MPIFFADTLDFLVTDVFLEEGIISTWTDVTIKFDFVKCIRKNKYT